MGEPSAQVSIGRYGDIVHLHVDNPNPDAEKRTHDLFIEAGSAAAFGRAVRTVMRNGKSGNSSMLSTGLNGYQMGFRYVITHDTGVLSMTDGTSVALDRNVFAEMTNRIYDVATHDVDHTDAGLAFLLNAASLDGDDDFD